MYLEDSIPNVEASIEREETAMLEKFVQAAIITFLLHLIVGLNPSTTISTKAAPPSSTVFTPVASSFLRSLE